MASPMSDAEVMVFLHRQYNKTYRERRRRDPVRQAQFLTHQRTYETSRRPRRKKLLVAFAVALAIAVPWRAQAHDWYPATCCSARDCRPVPLGEAHQDKNGFLFILINGRWRSIAPDKIQQTPSPDGLLHVCYSHNDAMPSDPDPSIFCVFIPAAM